MWRTEILLLLFLFIAYVGVYYNWIYLCLCLHWWAQPNHLYRSGSWSRTNNTFRIVIPVMVVGPRRVMSPSSIFGPLQNIYSLPCRWKDNSSLIHRRSVTKKEWISPSMSQRIKRGAPTHTYEHTPDTPTPIKQNFSYLSGLFVLTLASEALWQAPYRCNIAPVVFFRIMTYEDDPILNDLIWLTIQASSYIITKINYFK